MKILKLLNKKNFIILFTGLIYSISVTAEEKPIDIWDIEKKKTEVISETNRSTETKTITYVVWFSKLYLLLAVCILI